MNTTTPLGSITPDGNDRATVRFRRHLDADIDTVWAALTEPAELAAWMCPTTVELRVGGRIAHNMGDDDSQVDGEILALDPPRLLEYEWHYPGEDRSVLRYALQPDGAGTALTLTHRLLQTDHATGYGPGWHAYLDRLAAKLAGRPVASWEDSYVAARAAYDNS